MSTRRKKLSRCEVKSGKLGRFYPLLARKRADWGIPLPHLRQHQYRP